MLAPFHVDLVRVARSPRTEPEVHAVGELDNLLPQAEIVILILPSTEETRGLIGARQFALMRQGALIVNAARGPIVDTDALIDALQSGKIRAATRWPPAMELPQLAYHAPRCWIEPAVLPQCSSRSHRRVAPLHQRRADAERGPSRNLT